MKKLDVKAFGLAIGLLWALAMLVVGLLATVQFADWSVKMVEFISIFYIGFEATFVGSAIGAVWAFVDGLIGGIIFAWLYNKLSK